MLRLLALILIAFSLVFAPIQSAERSLRSIKIIVAAIPGGTKAPTHQDLVQSAAMPQLPCGHSCNGGGSPLVGIDPSGEMPALPTIVVSIQYRPWSASFASLAPSPIPDPPRLIG